MKKLMFLTLILMLLNPAKGYAVPDGCYVSYNTPNTCEPFGASEVLPVFSTESLNITHYGPVLGRIATRASNCQSTLFGCNSALGLYEGFWKACETTKSNLLDSLFRCAGDEAAAAGQRDRCNALLTTRDEDVKKSNDLLTTCVDDVKNCGEAFGKAATKIRKLKRACGPACRRIR